MPVSYVSMGSVNTDGAQVTTLAVPAPAGLNAAMLDLLLLNINSFTSDSLVLTVGSDGGAYTNIDGGRHTPSGPNFGWWSLNRKTGAASPGNATMTWTGPYPGRRAIGNRIAFSGVDLAAPIEAYQTASGVDNADVKTLTAPSVTAVTPGGMAVAWFLIGNDYGDFGTPSGWTKRFDQKTHNNTDAVATAIFTKPISTAGAVGDCVTTFTKFAPGNGFTTTFLNGMLVIKPDVAGAGGPTVVPGVRVNFLGL